MEALEELGKKWNFTTKVTLQLQFDRTFQVKWILFLGDDII